MISAIKNPCGLPEGMATHPATYYRPFIDKLYEHLAVVMPNADTVHDAGLGDRSSGLLGSDRVTSNEEFARWFTLHGNNRAQVRRVRPPVNRPHVLNSNKPVFEYDMAAAAGAAAAGGAAAVPPLPFDVQKYTFETRDKLWTEAQAKYEIALTELIDRVPAADKELFLRTLPTMTIRDMVEHLKSTYALANATDTTLLDECLEPADMAVPVGTALASFDAKLALVKDRRAHV